MAASHFYHELGECSRKLLVLETGTGMLNFSGVSFDILKVPVIDHQGDVKALERFT